MLRGYAAQNIAVSYRSQNVEQFDQEQGWHSFDPQTLRYLSVPVHLGGISLRGIIDTGATRSVIPPVTRNRLRLDQSGQTLATFFTERYSMPLCTAPSVRAGGMDFGPIELGCHPLEALEWAYPGEAPMLIGRDILAQVVLECSLPRKRLRLGSHFTGSEGYQSLELFHCAYGLPVIPIAVEGRSGQSALLDLGSDAACSMSAAYACQEGLLDRKTSSTLSAGLEGDVIAQVITLRSITIAGHELRDVPTFIIPNWKSSTPINLGWPAFAAFDLAFIHDRELHFRADHEKLAVPLPRDRSGIGAQRFADHLLIRHVAHNSPAEEAGLNAGDRITSINGRQVDAVYPTPGLRLGAQDTGTTLHLNLAEGRRMELTLRNYF